MNAVRALPMWIYVAVALLIALVAFGIGQIKSGMGVPFVIAASLSWVAYNVHRRRKW